MTGKSMKSLLKTFRNDSSGSVTVEAVIVLPLLVLILVATLVFNDMYGFKNVRQKATFTVADMISRETQPITAGYLDGAMDLFDTMTTNNGTNALRVSQVRYDGVSDSFSVDWSQVRGAGSLSAWTNADVQGAHGWLPALTDGERVLVVDSTAQYQSVFDVGQGQPDVEARVFFSPRFAPQVVYQ